MQAHSARGGRGWKSHRHTEWWVGFTDMQCIGEHPVHRSVMGRSIHGVCGLGP